MIGSLPGSMPVGMVEGSLQTNYWTENLIIYTYVLGQIYSICRGFMPAQSDGAKAGSENAVLRGQKNKGRNG
ncbi:hypothetical protein [Cupriavidus sp. IK-TO18]|uniref:hypothetical protein n=1 Tax=Cupriavidus sp. IK-TO18 TaxID=2782182 RepID=UPI00189890CC|nr:hypothetical protein [Cupriavidus sp. IK-TO18]MBF6992154.1 hypothetical protein [Cupriavidus sp. IK-TO18]